MRGNREGNLVMIADDNEFVRFLVGKWLGSHAEILEAGNGFDLITAYQRTKPDILFLDIHMPGKNGNTVLKEVLAADPDAFVIMISGDSNKENVVFAKQNGAKGFLTKPFIREAVLRYFNMCPTVGAKEPVSV